MRHCCGDAKLKKGKKHNKLDCHLLWISFHFFFFSNSIDRSPLFPYLRCLWHSVHQVVEVFGCRIEDFADESIKWKLFESRVHLRGAKCTCNSVCGRLVFRLLYRTDTITQMSATPITSHISRRMFNCNSTYAASLADRQSPGPVCLVLLFPIFVCDWCENGHCARMAYINRWREQNWQYFSQYRIIIDLFCQRRRLIVVQKPQRIRWLRPYQNAAFA